MPAFKNGVNLVKGVLIVSSEYHPPLDFAEAIDGQEFHGLHIHGKPKNLELLRYQTQLTELQMRRTKVADFSLLTGMRRMRDLSYITGSLRSCDVSFAAKSLERLWLTGHRSLEDVSSIGKCTRLQILSLVDLSRVSVFCELRPLTRLEMLRFHNLRHWPTLSGLERAKLLREVVLDKTQIDDGDFGPLLKLKQLKHVSGLEDAFGKSAAAEFRKLLPELETPRRRPW